MSQLMYTKKGAVRLPDDSFAHGGEGAVYSVERNPGIVAKIYHSQYRTKDREQKILAMLARPPKAGSSVAWPIEALYADRFCRQFVGFLMPRVQNSVKISDLYDPDTRSRHSWAFYIRVAQNLCAAVEAVHRSGHVCGDLNPANICVDEKTALVMLVDTDSFHVCQSGGHIFPCTVCRPEYVPAEIQRLVAGGRSLRDVKGQTFTVYTDRFALAIHIFSLLMNGCHPFACKVQSGLSAGQFALEKNIAAGRFAFLGGDPRIQIPIYAPTLDSLPKPLQELMRRAFCSNTCSPSMRPSPDEWHRALSDLAGSLKSCSQKHQYWSGAKKCPFCEISRQMNALNPAKKVKHPVRGTGGYIRRSGAAAAAAATVVNRKAVTPKNSLDETFGFLFAFGFWMVLEAAMLHALLILAEDYHAGLAVLCALAIIPWIPVWLIALWGQKNTYWWQGIRKFCRCTQVLAVLICILVGFWDAGRDGSSWAMGLMYSVIYSLIPIAFSQWRPKWTHKLL